MVIEDNYIHDMAGGSSAHADGIQSSGGANYEIRHNTIEGGTTSAIIMQAQLRTLDNVLIENNLLSKGRFSIYVRERDYGAPTNVVIRDNIIISGTQTYGFYSIDVPVTWENNVDENGNPINFH